MGARSQRTPYAHLTPPVLIGSDLGPKEGTVDIRLQPELPVSHRLATRLGDLNDRTEPIALVSDEVCRNRDEALSVITIR